MKKQEEFFLKKTCNQIIQLGAFLMKKFGNRNKRSKHNIAVINLHGIIKQSASGSPSLNFDNVRPIIHKAFKLKNLQAVALSINSPGGSPVQTEKIYNYIQKLRDEKVQNNKNVKIPIISFIDDIAASGGYWLAMAGDEIFASHSSIVGSIGVIYSGFGFVETINRLGIERRVYTQGANKSILDPFMPTKKDDIELIKQVQKDIYDHFVQNVKANRKEKLKLKEDELFSGKFWSGIRAKEIGLIDEIGDLYEVIKNRFSNAKLKHFSLQKQGLLRKLTNMQYSNKYTDFSNAIVEKVKEESYWNKFGL